MSYTNQYYLDHAGSLHFLSAQDQANAVALGLPLPDPSWTVATAAQVTAIQSPAPTAAQAAASVAQAALAAGLTVTSTGTPTLNGTYACDQLSQMDIIAIETSLNAGKGFPGATTTFNYPDVTGAMHSFSESNFTNFAAAVRDFVYALKSVIAGASTTLPAASTTIA
ncbi:hypothetical protein PQR65_05280 [Paraburkholderia nemoris]|uniref:hypothetical protein n=1 Tax=Paraburkholderia nemoris TaxID=2793076 RepID=UPI0038B6D953